MFSTEELGSSFSSIPTKPPITTLYDGNPPFYRVINCLLKFYICDRERFLEFWRPPPEYCVFLEAVVSWLFPMMKVLRLDEPILECWKVVVWPLLRMAWFLLKSRFSFLVFLLLVLVILLWEFLMYDFFEVLMSSYSSLMISLTATYSTSGVLSPSFVYYYDISAIWVSILSKDQSNYISVSATLSFCAWEI